MSILEVLTPENIADRFYTLPEKLQDALESKDNQLAVQIACVKNGVGDPDELKDAEAIMASVVLGFIHMDDLKEELVEGLGIKAESAQNIAAEVKKIFEPLKDEIEKAYSPLGRLPTATPKPPASGSDFTRATSPSAPVILDLKSTVLSPSPPISGADRPPKTPPAASPAPTPAPVPFILQKGSSPAPLAGIGDFKLNISSKLFESSKPASKPAAAVPRPPKPAELEIGKPPAPPKKPAIASTQAPAQKRVVHYADLRTALPGGVGAAAMPPAKPAPPSPVAPPASLRPPQAFRPLAGAPLPPAPMPSAPPFRPPETRSPEKPALSTRPAAGTPAPGPAFVPSPQPETPAPKTPKVVNYGPEEVK